MRSDSPVPRTKQEALDHIGALTCGGPWPVAHGSSEPREALTFAAEVLGVGFNLDASKPEIAEAIASAGDEAWDGECDSRESPSGGGSTVTLEGLRRVVRATTYLRTRPARSKQEALDRIGELICRRSRQVSTGSTEPREVFLDVAASLGVMVDTSSKPASAEQIARAGNQPWDETCDSRKTPSGGGSTVTLEGLNRVIRAIAIIKIRKVHDEHELRRE